MSLFLVRRHLDDALDVFGVHGVGGITGSILVGVFASTVWNPKGPAGLLEGNGMQIVKQFVAVVFTSVWSFVFTLLILWIINKFTPVKVNQQTVGDDLDITEFDEDAYREKSN